MFSKGVGLTGKSIGTVTKVGNVAKGGGFGSMMEASEAARYSKYWQNYAPKQITPGTTRLDWLRQSGRTGRMESSRVCRLPIFSTVLNYTIHLILSVKCSWVEWSVAECNPRTLFASL